MRKLLVWAMCILLAISTASALYGISYDTYSGQAARERRATFDPFSRDRYYGEGYVQPLGGFGSGGPVTGTKVGTGSKSAYSSVFNLDTNEFWRRGRSAGRVSNQDPRMRGFSRLDTVVSLYPFSFLERNYPTGSPTSTMHLTKATARVLSLSNSYGSGFRKRPQGEVHMKMRELTPLSEEELYEAWLVDDESEYFLSMGLFKVGLGGTGSLDFTINNHIVGYDRIIITKEPFPDYDPSPSNEIILVGDIDPSRKQAYEYFPGVTIR